MTAAQSNCERFAASPIGSEGTPAAVWRSADLLPALDLSSCRALILIGAHPDDETLGFGATAAHLAARGIDISVVSVTDGESAYPDAPAAHRGALARQRRQELQAALGTLGLPAPQSLGLPDGQLSAHEAQLAAQFTDILDRAPADTWTAAPWRGDGHPDHEAVGRAAAAATSNTGLALLEYPVWMWHWGRPADPAIPWDRAFATNAPESARLLKCQAAQCFQSQIHPMAQGVPPVLPAHVLSRLLSVGELVFRNPAPAELAHASFT